jgi:hypothetical protein
LVVLKIELRFFLTGRGLTYVPLLLFEFTYLIDGLSSTVTGIDTVRRGSAIL